MSAEDVELARTSFEVLADQGVDAVLPLVHPEFEMTTPQELAAEPMTYRGRDGARLWFDSFYEVMDEIQLVPKRLEDAGQGRVLMELSLLARGQSSGIEVEQQAVAVVEVRDGMLARMSFFADLEEARAALAADD